MLVKLETWVFSSGVSLGAVGSMVKGFVGELAGYPLGSGAHVSIEAEPLPDISKLRCFLT